MASTGTHIFKATFVFALIVQVILWSQSRSVHEPGVAPCVLGALLKRSGNAFEPIADTCEPLSVPLAEQCAHVNAACPVSDTVLSLPYLHYYFCASPTLRHTVFAALVLWLTFLFSTLGISASDFFCPNLASLAELLGLDENVAGVTFLALGNGSPDLFSTFSAMRAEAGALAVGELLGAASFIVSVVVGAMCIIRPFSVPARPFLRDVGFFTVSVAMLLIALWDGRLYAWEAGALIVLYGIYVTTVVVGTWWENRQYRLKELEEIARAEYAEETLEPYRDEPTDFLAVPISSMRVRSHSTPAAPTLAIDNVHLQPQHEFPLRSRSASVSPSVARSTHPSPLTAPRIPSFSLVGALEFRQVCASLRHESAAEALSIFESPVTPYAGGYYQRHHERDPFDVAAAGMSRRPSVVRSYLGVDHEAGRGEGMADVEAVPLHPRSPRSSQQPSPYGHPVSLPATTADGPRSTHPVTMVAPPRDIPLIETTAASPPLDASDAFLAAVEPTFIEYLLDGTADGGGDGAARPPITSPTRTANLSLAPVPLRRRRSRSASAFPASRTRPHFLQRIRRAARFALHVLFPTLHNWHGKSLSGKVASVLAAPAVLALTLTLPVHVSPKLGTACKELDERLSTHVFPLSPGHPAGDHPRRFSRYRHHHHHHHHHHTHHHHGRRLGQQTRSESQKTRSPSAADALLLHVPVPPVPGERLVDVVDVTVPDETGRMGRAYSPELCGDGIECCYDDTCETDDDYGYGDACDPIAEQETRACAQSITHGDVLMMEDQVQEELHELGFNIYLCAAQLVLGPLFCLMVIFSGSYSSVHLSARPYVITASVGAACAALLLWVQERVCERTGSRAKGQEEIERWYAERPAVQMLRCAAGFFVSVIWIMAIADEVVGVLKTFGHIFGLSDALIGLTIFAIGNSLADFVANISVARFAPVMAFAACFGGPMLNILLGVGGAGLMMTRRKTAAGSIPNLDGGSGGGGGSGGSALARAVGAVFTTNAFSDQYYPIDFNGTLMVSSIGLLVLLLATLIVVPLNGFYLSRAWGIVLIVSYFAIMVVNIGFEMHLMGDRSHIR